MSASLITLRTDPSVAVGVFDLRDRYGDTWISAVIKVTFDVAPRRCTIARRQDRVSFRTEPSLNGPPEDDLPPKPRAEVLVVGHAYAPGGKATTELVVSISVEAFQKSIQVTGDRYFDESGRLSAPQPFLSMALGLDRAAGGPQSANPLGMAPGVLGARVRVPNLNPPGFVPTRPDEPIPLVTLGPIPAWFPARKEKLGGDGRTRWLDVPPEQVAPTFFQTALADQRVTAIPADARIRLENLHPLHALLETRLPGVAPRAFLRCPGQADEEVDLIADTLVFETVRSTATMTWRALIAAHPGTEVMELVVSLSNEPTRDAALILDEPTASMSNQGEIVATLPFSGSSERSLNEGRSQAATSLDALARLSAAVPAVHGQALTLARPLLTEELGERLRVAAPAPSRSVTDATQPLDSDGVAAAVDAIRKSAESYPGIVANNPSPMPPIHGALETIGTKAVRALQSSPVSVGIASVRSAPEAASAIAQPLPSAPPAQQPPRADAQAKEAVRLIWFDAELPARLREHPTHGVILAQRELRQIESGVRPESEHTRDRRDVVELLLNGLVGGDAPRKATTALDGEWDSPINVVAGELSFPLDDVELLRNMVTAVSPMTATDKKLKETVDSIHELIETSALKTASFSQNMLARIREAYLQAKRPLPYDVLEAQVARMLLEQRQYQRRTLFGRGWFRGLLRPSGAPSNEVLPTYVPDALLNELPLFQRFPARLIATLEPKEDEVEASDVCLRVLALARLIP